VIGSEGSTTSVVKRQKIRFTRKVRRGLGVIAGTPEYSDIFNEVLPRHANAKERSDARAAFAWIEENAL